MTGRLAVATACYLCWASGAAVVAIVRNMPAAFGGLSTGLSVTNDFLIGFGTALSPPLWWMLPGESCAQSHMMRSPPGGSP